MPEFQLDPEKAARAKEILASQPGADFHAERGRLQRMQERIDPFSSTGLEKQYQPESHEYDQELWRDMMSGVWNSLVVGGGEGVANLIPTVGQAMGADSDFFESWKGNVTNWFDSQRTLYSDEANKPIEGFSDINLRNSTKAVGQGVGFILGILGGGSSIAKGVGLLSKGAQTANTAQNAARVGSFLAGTTMMYPEIDKEARKAGLDPTSAARFALGVSGLVSLTEGAALEWIGKTISKPVTSTITKASVRETLAKAGTKDPIALQNLFLNNFGKKLGAKGAAAFESAAIEGGQEFAQTYIEEGAKKLYDEVFASEKEVGKGKFGADPLSYKTFVEATFGGLIGGVLGGAMGGGGTVFQGNELAKESMFGYVNNAVQQNKPENIAKITMALDDMVAKGKMKPEAAESAKQTVADLAKFSTDFNVTDVKNGTALYQMFQLDKLKKDVLSTDQYATVSEDANDKVKSFAEEKKSKISLVSERIQENFDFIFDNKKPETKKKDVFNKKLDKYKKLVKDIHLNNIEMDEVTERLDKIYNPVKAEKTEVKGEAATKPPKTTEKAVNLDVDGMTIPSVALENTEDIRARANDVMEGKTSAEDFYASMQKEYGIGKEQVTKITEDGTIDERFLSGELKETAPAAAPEKTFQQKLNEVKYQIDDKNTLIRLPIKEVLESNDKVGEPMRRGISDFSDQRIDAAKDFLSQAVEGKNTFPARATLLSQKENGETMIGDGRRRLIAAQEMGATEATFEVSQDQFESIQKRFTPSPIKQFADKIVRGESTASPEDQQFYENNRAAIENELRERQAAEQTTATPQPVEAEPVRQEPVSEPVVNPQPTTEEATPVLEPASPAIETDPDFLEPVDESFDQFMNSADAKLMEDLMSSFGMNKPKEQRLFVSAIPDTIASNPQLFNKIRNHFRKIFPNVPVEVVDGLIAKHGFTVLGRITEKGIQIAKDKAHQSTLIHEYAHIYFELLGKDHPLIKIGKQIIAGSKYHQEAKALYPDLSADEQLEEALIQALAERSLEQLQAKFEGNAWQKFLEFAKRFWNAAKNLFAKDKSGDFLDLLSKQFLQSKPIKTDLGFMKGMIRNQVYQDPRFFTSTQIVQNTVAQLRSGIILNGTKGVNLFNANNIRFAVYQQLLGRYISERSGNTPAGDIMVFEGIDMDAFKAEGKNDASALRDALINQSPTMFALIENSIENIAKVPLPEAEVISEDTDLDHKTSVDKVKADKKVIASVRSIISSMVDENGNLISTNDVFRYIASISNTTLGTEGFMERLNADAINNKSFVAKRLFGVLSTSSAGVRNSIAAELSSLIQQVSNKVFIGKDKASGDEVIRIRQINRDYETKESAKRKLSRIETFPDTPQMWEGLFDGTLSKFLSNRKNFEMINSKTDEAKQLFGGILERIMGEDISKDISDKIYNSAVPGFLLRNYADVMNGRKTIKDITGYVNKFVELQEDVDYIENSYINSKGNAVTSTKFGYWISELNSLIFNDKSYREKMLRSPLYKDNTVLKYAINVLGKMKWGIHDAIDNEMNGIVNEYSDQVASDLELSALIHFANDSSKKDYWQVYGINADRTHSTYFKVPRIPQAGLADEYRKLAEAEAFSIKGREITSKLVSDFNKMSINFMDASGKIYTPFDKGYSEKKLKAHSIDVARLIKNVDRYQLRDKIARDHVSKSNALYSSLEDMVKNFYLNEALNRQHLTNLYQGPMIHRKSVSDVIKRAGGNNSGGKRVELDKPVITIVVDVPSKIIPGVYTSDSFSFNGSKLHSKIKSFFGELDVVGTNMKDQLYQVNPETGKMLFLKMSTFGLIGEKGNSNIHQMFDPNRSVKNGAGYPDIADAIFDIESHVGDSAYVKIVDSKSLKGNEGDFKAVNLDEFVLMVNSGKIQDVISNHSFKTNFHNYRVPFNLNKKLSKVDVADQSVVLSTQLAKIALNVNDPEAIQEFENKIKTLLELNLKVKEAGNLDSSATINALKEGDRLLNAMVKNMDELDQNSLSQIMREVIRLNKTAKTPITAFDHPNLTRMIQQFISTKLSKTGIRAEIAGNYLQMIPNYGNDLKWYRQENGQFQPAEIAVPWSMYGATREAAEKLLSGSPDGLRVVAVRVPASAEVSTFVAKVKYFTDGDTNATVLPDEFVKMSDADHDGDKTFIYREDLSNNDGVTTVKDSQKTRIFNSLYDKISSEQIRANTKNDLSLDSIKTIVNEYGFNQEDGYRLDTYSGVADVASKMSFGGDAIGIMAVTGKVLSILSQSNEKLIQPLLFGYDLTKDPATRQLTNDKTLQAFNNKSLIDAAKILQAALDMGNDPILLSTGINKHTINVATTLTMLGVDMKEVIGFLNDPTIKQFVNKLDDEISTFNTGAQLAPRKILDKYMAELSGTESIEKLKDVDSINKAVALIGGVLGSYNEGQVYSTKKGDAFFTLSEASVQPQTQNGKLYEVKFMDKPMNQQVATLEKFIEIGAISSDIKKLIPVVQMDKSLPNNGADVRRVKDLIDELKNEGLKITVGNVLQRPLIKHYIDMINKQREINEKHFVTESKAFVDMVKNIAPYLKSQDAHSTISDKFLQMVAQNDLSGNNPNGADFVDVFGGKVFNIINAINGKEVIPENEDYANDIKGLYDLKQSGSTADYEAAIANYSPEMRTMVEEFETAVNTADTMRAEYTGNTFLRYLEIFTDKNGKKLIRSNDQYRKTTDSVKKLVRQDFEKLPDDLKSEFYDYQLYRFGISEKLGSLIDMMPVEKSLQFMELMTQYHGVETMGNAVEYNVVYALRDNLGNLPLDKAGKPIPKKGYFKVGNSVVHIENGVLQRIKTGEFQSNDYFTKFDLDIDSEVVDKSRIDQLKKECA